MGGRPIILSPRGGEGAKGDPKPVPRGRVSGDGGGAATHIPLPFPGEVLPSWGKGGRLYDFLPKTRAPGWQGIGQPLTEKRPGSS